MEMHKKDMQDRNVEEVSKNHFPWKIVCFKTPAYLSELCTCVCVVRRLRCAYELCTGTS